MAQMSPSRPPMTEDATVRHHSAAPQFGHLYQVARSALFFGRPLRGAISTVSAPALFIRRRVRFLGAC
jgi:hypothetical protein